MNLFKKIFGFKKSRDKSNGEFIIDAYRRELAKLNLFSYDDLEKIVEPLVKNATKIIIEEPSIPPDNSQLISHFGGQPYFETGEEWPKSGAGSALDFVFQIFNQADIQMPNHIKLVQFFYDFDESPWETGGDGWFVKIYDRLESGSLNYISKPEELDQSNFCEIRFEDIKSLPDWEGIGLYHMEALKLSSVLDEDLPWENYNLVVKKLIGAPNYQSQLGGYPKWIQQECFPRNADRKPLDLLFQIDSEDNARLMWGDAGLVYVFYDTDSQRIEFSLQCH